MSKQPIWLMMILALPTQAQDKHQELRAAMDAYFATVQAKDYEGTISYLYPGLFSLLPADMMLEALRQTQSDTTMEIQMYDMAIEKISKPIQVEHVTYILMRYHFVISYTLDPPTRGEGGTLEPDMLKYMYESMARLYNRQNVQLDIITRTVSASLTREMYGILDPRYPGWKFLEKKPGAEKTLQQILPEQVIQKL